MATTTLSFNQIAAASSVDMVNSFAQDFSKLREMLAHSQFSVLPNGTNLTVAAKTATLQDGTAAENAEIPASTIVGDASIVTLTYKKYRALIGFERIATEGEGAVVNADNLLRGQLQGDVKQAIADGLATTGNTAVATASGDSVQKRCAKLWAALSAGRESYATTPVFFANPSAVADYLGAANITVQTAFGVQYLVNFLGLGTLILSAKIPATTIYATAEENLVVAAADISSINGAGFATDQSGVIAVKHAPKDENAAMQVVAIAGIKVVPAVASHIYKSVLSA